MSPFTNLTELCVYGVSLGFGLSFVLWGIGLPARLFRDLLK